MGEQNEGIGEQDERNGGSGWSHQRNAPENNGRTQREGQVKFTWRVSKFVFFTNFHSCPRFSFCGNWLPGSRAVFFFVSRAYSTARYTFCGKILPVNIVFLVVAFLLNQIAIPLQIYWSAPRRIRYRPVGNDTWRHSKHAIISEVTKPSITPLNCHFLGKQVQKSSRSKRSLKAKANHSLKILFRINHHTGAWVHWHCQSGFRIIMIST